MQLADKLGIIKDMVVIISVRGEDAMDFSNVTILEHPLIQHKMSFLRDKHTAAKEFRELVEEVALLLAYEVTRNLPVYSVEVETPLEMAKCQRIHSENIAVVPILRAGLGMTGGFQKLLPAAKVGHLGMYRNEETLEPVAYFAKLPEGIADMQVIVVDPMLATGGSGSAALTYLKKNGVKQLKYVSIIAAPVGIETLQAAHPDVEVYVAQLDDKLNENGYIIPGLGDAGDRIFGTN